MAKEIGSFSGWSKVLLCGAMLVASARANNLKTHGGGVGAEDGHPQATSIPFNDQGYAYFKVASPAEHPPVVYLFRTGFENQRLATEINKQLVKRETRPYVRRKLQVVPYVKGQLDGVVFEKVPGYPDALRVYTDGPVYESYLGMISRRQLESGQPIHVDVVPEKRGNWWASGTRGGSITLQWDPTTGALSIPESTTSLDIWVRGLGDNPQSGTLRDLTAYQDNSQARSASEPE